MYLRCITYDFMAQSPSAEKPLPKRSDGIVINFCASAGAGLHGPEIHGKDMAASFYCCCLMVQPALKKVS